MKNGKENKQNRGQFNTFRVLLIVMLSIILTASFAAWAAQRWGGAMGLVIGSVGLRFEAQIESGHYVVGRDIPAGSYYYTAGDRSGTMYKVSSGTRSDEIALSAGDTGTMELFPDEIITVTGTGLSLLCKKTTGEYTPRASTSSTRDVKLTTADCGNGYIVGRDIPAGIYKITAYSGSGMVTSGSGQLAVNTTMDAETQNGVKTFSNVELVNGDTLLLDGVDIILSLYL